MRKILKKEESPDYKRIDLDEDLFGHSAHFSALSYQDPHKISTKLSAKGAIKIHTYSYEELQAFIAEFEDFAVVAFKGIDEEHEMTTLLKFWKTEFCGIKVHAGFANCMERIAPSLIQDLQSIDSSKKLLYTGHSFEIGRAHV